MEQAIKHMSFEMAEIKLSPTPLKVKISYHVRAHLVEGGESRADNKRVMQYDGGEECKIQ